MTTGNEQVKLAKPCTSLMFNLNAPTTNQIWKQLMDSRHTTQTFHWLVESDVKQEDPIHPPAYNRMGHWELAKTTRSLRSRTRYHRKRANESGSMLIVNQGPVIHDLIEIT